MARMLGDMQGSHCPSCHGKPGVDCPDTGRGSREQKRVEERDWFPFEVGAEGWAMVDAIWDAF